jgi:hypothetical protein
MLRRVSCEAVVVSCSLMQKVIFLRGGRKHQKHQQY